MVNDRAKTLGCSAASGGIGAFVTSPVECLRVRFQVEPAATRPSAILAFGGNIIKSEGFLKGLFLPGNAAWCASMSSAFGLRMVLYDPLRDAIDRLNAEGGSTNAFLAGICTGCLTNALSCPLFNAKSASLSQQHLFCRLFLQHFVCLHKRLLVTTSLRSTPTIVRRGGCRTRASW